MTTKTFFRIVLRTTDERAARAFYADVLRVSPEALNVLPLHAQALARGAPPHWLGFIDVGEVAAASAFFVSRGAQPLAPTWVNPEGLEAAVMRDPGGAVIALARPPSVPARGGPELMPAAYLLNTNDAAAAKRDYGELLGWSFTEPVAVEGLGPAHPFSWRPGTEPVGLIVDIRNRPGVHPHWLFQLPVSALDESLERVRLGGGVVHGAWPLEGGARVAVCEDPQGGAFALRQAAA